MQFVFASVIFALWLCNYSRMAPERECVPSVQPCDFPAVCILARLVNPDVVKLEFITPD